MIPVKTPGRGAKNALKRVLAALLATAACALPADDSVSVMDRYVAMAIQGDLARAEALFSTATLGERSAGAALLASYRERFVHPPPPATGGLAAGIVSAYQGYWRKSLLDTSGREAYERELDRELVELLPAGKSGVPGAPSAASVARALEAQGLFHFQSDDPPLRDLLIWGSQQNRNYSVQLTDQKLGLTVHFLDDFLLQGWKDFASLGLTSTTGWVEDGELYCIAWAYDLASENFEVSYLKHEARHLVDLERYPQMQSTELEYRAKLTELAFAHRTLTRVLENFADTAAQNPASPHAMANWRVVRDIYWSIFEEELPENFNRWSTLRGSQVNRAARELLALNTRQHEQRGDSTP